MSLSFKQYLIEVHEAEGEIDFDKLVEQAKGDSEGDSDRGTPRSNDDQQ